MPELEGATSWLYLLKHLIFICALDLAELALQCSEVCAFLGVLRGSLPWVQKGDRFNLGGCAYCDVSLSGSHGSQKALGESSAWVA